jgi:hypothetical protein
MRWYDSIEEQVRAVREGEAAGRCPGCNRRASTFATFYLPNVDQIGIACERCLDAETVERLDPRMDGARLRQALRLSDARFRGEGLNRAARRRRRKP